MSRNRFLLLPTGRRFLQGRSASEAAFLVHAGSGAVSLALRPRRTDPRTSLGSNNRSKVLFAVTALLAIAAAPSPIVEVRQQVEARANFDTSEIRLSGEVSLTLSVEGPGPLSVTPAKPVVGKGNWRVHESGLPIREVLPSGREKWTQAYRLSPLIFGNTAVPIGPLKITSGSQPEIAIEWDEKKTAFIQVIEPKVAASVDSLRPPTDIERVPPPPDTVRTGSPWRFAIVPALLIVALTLLVLARRRRTPVTRRDANWAMNELDSKALTPERCALVLRQFLAFQFAIPAEMRTTPELANDFRVMGKMDESKIADWQGLLEECDMARFSGTSAFIVGLTERAKALVSLTKIQEEVPASS